MENKTEFAISDCGMLAPWLRHPGYGILKRHDRQRKFPRQRSALEFEIVVFNLAK
jgi:hypothetical protein